MEIMYKGIISWKRSGGAGSVFDACQWKTKLGYLVVIVAAVYKGQMLQFSSPSSATYRDWREQDKSTSQPLAHLRLKFTVVPGVDLDTADMTLGGRAGLGTSLGKTLCDQQTDECSRALHPDN